MNAQLIIGLIFLIAIIAPFVYLAYAGKARVKNAEKALRIFSNEKNVTIDEKQYWCDKGIGISRSQKVLLFINGDKKNLQTHAVDLTLVKKCGLDIGKETIGLLLELKQTNGIKDLRIQLYSMQFDDTSNFGFHHQLAKKWAGLVNQVIHEKASPVKKSA